MPSATELTGTGLALQQGARIKRRLSAIEYFHACTGRSGGVQPQREVVTIVEGDGPPFDVESWRAALAQASAANPGSHLRMVGNRWWARWLNDGQPPNMRLLDDVAWDGRSSSGADFIVATPLSLENGPTVELILVSNPVQRRFVVLRTLHAVMDGRGSLHFLRDIFRALCGESLEGSNAGFSDVDMLRTLSPRKSASKYVRTDWVTGPPQHAPAGDVWSATSIPTGGENILARVAEAIAAYAHQRSQRAALFAVPVDLRPRLPELHSTGNFSSMLLVPIEPGEGRLAFRQKLARLREADADLFWIWPLGLTRAISLKNLDRLLSRLSTGLFGRPPETAVLSNLGRLEPADFSCDGFRASTVFVVPLANCVYVTIAGIGDQILLAVGMQKFLASEGRFERLMDHVEAHLSDRRSD